MIEINIRDRMIAKLEHGRAAVSDEARWAKGPGGPLVKTETIDEPGLPRSYCMITSLYANEDFTTEVLAVDDVLQADMIAGHRCNWFIGRALEQLLGQPRSIIAYNDSAETTHAEMLEAYDLAIDLAKKHDPESSWFLAYFEEEPA
jgi:hypothetical protein